jgi:hypothetical protein
MLAWIRKARPPIVVIENVCSAPWKDMVDLFDVEGYDATHTKLNTKRY